MEEIVVGGFGEVLLTMTRNRAIGGQAVVVSGRGGRVLLPYEAIQAIRAFAEVMEFEPPSRQQVTLMHDRIAAQLPDTEE